ncbi:MAG: hypothetical protein MUE73_19080 [Planctomycetes bacterium]|jgi:hypothetical protein|nr:hypothetical protein [Planctomycetota bacterium]
MMHLFALLLALLAPPAEDLASLLDRLSDRSSDPVEEIVGRVEDGAANPAIVVECARALRGHPQAFVRRRAAEVLLHVAPVEGELWLLAELALYRSWNRVDGILCTGDRTGFPGRVDRLLRQARGAIEPDPYDTTGEPERLPAEAFRVLVAPIPWADPPGFVALVLNAGREPFRMLPNHSVALRGANVGGGASWSSHPELVQEVPPGGVVARVHLPEGLAAVEGLDLRLTLPGRRAALARLALPGAPPRPASDIEAFTEGLRSSEAVVRRFMAHRFRDEPRVLERLSPADRAAALAALVGAAEAPALPDADFRFWIDGDFPSCFTEPAFESILALRDSWDAKTLLAILRGRSPYGATCLFPAPEPLRRAVLSAAIGADDPVIIRNAAASLCREDFEPRDLGGAMAAAVERWLVSPVPVVRRAGLCVAARHRIEVATATVDRALADPDPAVRRTALFAAARLTEAVELAPFAAAVDGADESVAIAALDALLAPEARLTGSAARTFALPRLLAEPRPPRPFARRLASLFLKAAPAPEDAPLLIDLWRRTEHEGFLSALVEVGYTRKIPALAACDGPVALDLLPHELSRRPGEPFEEHYTQLLLTAVLTGNDRMVRLASGPLAAGTGEASLRALELGAGVLDEEAARAAARAREARLR